MKKNYLFSLFLLHIFAFSIFGQNIDVSKLPTIQVTGTAEIQVVPDEVDFNLRVSKTSKNLPTAKQQNDENIAKIIALTKQFGINPKDVKTDFISVREQFEYITPKGEEESRRVFTGYVVSKTIVVKLRDISKFEDFFSQVIKVGVSEVGNVQFKSSQLRKFKDQARAMAIRAAKEKAEAIVKEIGQSIGKAVSIEEENIDEGGPRPLSNITSNTISTSSDGGETLSVGTITVKAQLEVEFLLN